MVANLEGYTQIPEEDQKKAKAFFAHARTKADTGQFDYAIEMMISGLQLDPDDIEAHQYLRELSLKRKASGGKDLGMFEKPKYKDTKDHRETMLNRERLLAYDPGNTEHMIEICKRAFEAGFFDTIMWMGPLTTRAIQDSGKPDVRKYLALASLYERVKRYDESIQNVQLAAQLRPDDMELATRLKNLGALQTMDKGNYDKKDVKFRDSVKDIAKQEELMEADKDIRSAEGMKKAIESAERELAASPADHGKLMKLVEALMKTDDPEFESRAIEKLEEAFKRTQSFRYRQSIGEINMRQMARMERSIRDALRATPSDEQLKKELAEFHRDRVLFELSEYQLLVENYPTESRFRFEAATRLFALHNWDEAIPALQQIRQDPKYRTKCSLYLGRAFFEAGFLDEAQDTLDEIIGTYQLKGDDDSKEMYYWRARVLEAKEMYDPAIKSYSQVAQWDFNYRDVQVRIKALRARPKA